jgi:hypothetical protein
MKYLKTTISLAFLFFLVPMTAQVKYSYEEIKKTYETETIILLQNSYEQNGRLNSVTPLIPGGKLRREIEANGGVEANAHYKQYINILKNYWLLTLAGLAAFIALLSSSAIITGGVSLLFTIGLVLWTTSVILLGQKAYRYLARAVWYYNWHVLFKKKPAAG